MKFLILIAAVVVGAQALSISPIEGDDLDRLYQDSYTSKYITTCSESDKCVTENAECVKGRCSCQRGFVAYSDYTKQYSSYSYSYGISTTTGKPNGTELSEKNRKIQHISCLPYVKFDEVCKTDLQCKATMGTGASCQKFMDGVNGACACASYGYKEHQGRCYSTKNLGDECDSSLNCKTRGAQCVDLPADFSGDKSSYSSYAVSIRKYGKARACQCPKEAPHYNSATEACVAGSE